MIPESFVLLSAFLRLILCDTRSPRSPLSLWGVRYRLGEAPRASPVPTSVQSFVVKPITVSSRPGPIWCVPSPGVQFCCRCLSTSSFFFVYLSQDLQFPGLKYFYAHHFHFPRPTRVSSPRDFLGCLPAHPLPDLPSVPSVTPSVVL